jgi:hypothetical protein
MTSVVLVAALSVVVFLPNDCYCTTCECNSISLEEKNCCSEAPTTCDCCHSSAPVDEPSAPVRSHCQCISLNDPYIAATAEVVLDKPVAFEWFCPSCGSNPSLDMQTVRFASATTVPIVRSDHPLFITYCCLLN